MDKQELEDVAESQMLALKDLRRPFDQSKIGKLPKPTKLQTDEVKRDYTKGIRCELCGGWHHPKVVHLDYVGHAALTDRLLDVDPFWTWEPFAVDSQGLPLLDNNNGLWIRLTVCGVTRIGYGDSGTKRGGDATKEAIGDALRNAGMRFGAALDLWHKGDLHDNSEAPKTPTVSDVKPSLSNDRLGKAIQAIKAGEYEKKTLLANFLLTDEQYQTLDEALRS